MSFFFGVVFPFSHAYNVDGFLLVNHFFHGTLAFQFLYFFFFFFFFRPQYSIHNRGSCCFPFAAAAVAAVFGTGGADAVLLLLLVSFVFIIKFICCKSFYPCSLFLFSLFFVVQSFSLAPSNVLTHSTIYIYNLYGRCKSNHSIEYTHTHTHTRCSHDLPSSWYYTHFVCLSLTDAYIFSSIAPSFGSIESHARIQQDRHLPIRTHTQTLMLCTQTDSNVFKTVISELIICRWQSVCVCLCVIHTLCMRVRERIVAIVTPCAKERSLFRGFDTSRNE